MIERIDKKYNLECDYCNNFKEGFKTFEEVLEYERIFGWKNINIEGIWVIKCPKCISMNNFSN